MIPRALIYLAAVSLAIAADDRKALETRAAKGEAEAQYLLAEKLYWAEGGPRDLEQAVDFAEETFDGIAGTAVDVGGFYAGAAENGIDGGIVRDIVGV